MASGKWQVASGMGITAGTKKCGHGRMIAPPGSQLIRLRHRHRRTFSLWPAAPFYPSSASAARFSFSAAAAAAAAAAVAAAAAPAAAAASAAAAAAAADRLQKS